jgi:hypothetical protein
VSGPFEGDGYYVTHVRHTFDLKHGFRTRFEAERVTDHSRSLAPESAEPVEELPGALCHQRGCVGVVGGQ